MSPGGRSGQATREQDLCIIRIPCIGVRAPRDRSHSKRVPRYRAPPFPTLAVTLALNGGGRSVDNVPVAVYCGSAVTLPAGSLVIDVGGHTNSTAADGGIVPAPAPPVCHA